MLAEVEREGISTDIDRNGWGATAIDALSTAIIMEKWDVVEQILDFVPKIDFDRSNTANDISLFETTIRYLGGLISGKPTRRGLEKKNFLLTTTGYDLLTGPFADRFKGDSRVDALLSQAKHLADNLKVAFDTPSGIPDNNLYFSPPRRAGRETNGLATTGTLVLEWTRLSDLTGDPEYAQLAQKAESYLLFPEPKDVGEPFPGLLGTHVRLSDGEFLDGNGGWGAETDSFYEYLIKMYLYDPERFGEYKDRWVKAADSSLIHLVSHPSSKPELTFLAEWRGKELNYYGQHRKSIISYAFSSYMTLTFLVACFNGGNFILGGLMLLNQSYIMLGLALTDGCHATYAGTPTGIGPELFGWEDLVRTRNTSHNPGPPVEQKEFYDRNGFWIRNGQYALRPEVIESYYYAYRATGDRRYQEWAWDAFKAINATCRVGSGYSGVTNVGAPGGGAFNNFQESFWLAETLKYSYLIQAEVGFFPEYLEDCADDK